MGVLVLVSVISRHSSRSESESWLLYYNCPLDVIRLLRVVFCSSISQCLQYVVVVFLCHTHLL